MQKQPTANDTELINEDDLIGTLIAISIVSKQLAKKLAAKSTPTINSQKEDNQMYKHYGLTGETVKVKLKKGDSDRYPWQGITVPVLITGEYENFLVGTVLPHYAPHGFGLSHPYPITICKHDIQIGEMIINGGTIR